MLLAAATTVKEVGQSLCAKPLYAYVGVPVPFGVTRLWLRRGHQGQRMMNRTLALASARAAHPIYTGKG